MRNRIITVPEAVNQKLATLGEDGTNWLKNLPDLIRELEQEWQLTVGRTLEGGTEAYVAEATTNDGIKAVLKIAIPPKDGNTVLVNEITALTFANGYGYARLLRSNLNRRVLLLEALGTPLRNLNYTTKDQIDIICSVLKASWKPVPTATSLPNGADMAEWFSQFISSQWQILNKPCSAKVIDTALIFVESRTKAFKPEKAVLVHGDAHNNNLLQSLSPNAQFSFKLIDPDGIIAEPAYDLGVLMREWLDELIDDPIRLAKERCAYLSKQTNQDPEAIWQWGFLQSVATGLILIQVGQLEFGSQMLGVAEAWATVAS